MVSKTVVCLNDEPVEDYKAVEIEECGLLPFRSFVFNITIGPSAKDELCDKLRMINRS